MSLTLGSSFACSGLPPGIASRLKHLGMANKGPLSGIQPFHLAGTSCSHVLVRSGLTVGMAELDATKICGLAHGSTLSLIAVWICADLLFHLLRLGMPS